MMSLFSLLAIALLAPAQAETDCNRLEMTSFIDSVEAAIPAPAPQEEEATADANIEENPKDADPLAVFKGLIESPSIKDAPATVDIPVEVWSNGYKAWGNSLPKGVAQEQGGLLVRNPDKSFEFKRGPAGGFFTWTPNYQNVLQEEELVGVLHTHPYTEGEGGWTHVTFSGNDIATMINTEAPIEFVQSGDGMFMLAKSKEWNDTIAAMSDGDKAYFRDRITTEFTALSNRWLAQGQDFPNALHAGAAEIARKHGLIYYYGKSGESFKQVK